MSAERARETLGSTRKRCWPAVTTLGSSPRTSSSRWSARISVRTVGMRSSGRSACRTKPHLTRARDQDGRRRGARCAIEADFVGTHTAHFAGEAATGRSVRVPYSVVYDLDADKIKGLRIYMPIDDLLGQIRRASQAAMASSSA